MAQGYDQDCGWFLQAQISAISASFLSVIDLKKKPNYLLINMWRWGMVWNSWHVGYVYKWRPSEVKSFSVRSGRND